MKRVETIKFVDESVFNTEIETDDGPYGGPPIQANSWEEAIEQAQKLTVKVKGKLDTIVTLCECD